MQGHHVKATTARGQALIHLRFSGAMKELADDPGRQTDRSHWFSGHAFAGLARAGGLVPAHLVDGRTPPVSRSHLAEVKRMAPVRPMPAPPH